MTKYNHYHTLFNGCTKKIEDSFSWTIKRESGEKIGNSNNLYGSLQARQIKKYTSYKTQISDKKGILFSISEGVYLFSAQNYRLIHNVSEGIIQSNQSLVLQKVRKKLSGNYICSASNSQGSGKSNQLFISVKCKEKPLKLHHFFCPGERCSQFHMTHFIYACMPSWSPGFDLYKILI